MSGDFEFKDAKAMLEGARQARSQMVIFHHDSQVPGEVASLARLFWRHIPEMAKRAGVEIDPIEGHPRDITSSDQSLVRMISKDMAEGRSVVNWLAKVTSDQTKAMFNFGKDNAMENVIQKFSEDRGFVRDDNLAIESGKVSPPEPVKTVEALQRDKAMAFSFASHMQNQRSF